MRPAARASELASICSVALAPLRFVLVLFVLALGATAASAQSFPALTGRVVDRANIIDPATEASLTAKLAAFEQKSSDQIVIATVNNLGGDSIENYANLLFRNWKLGQAGENNGILLLVAKDDRKMRIEVGYGLEGTLTDLHSSLIINNIMVPAFRAGDFSGGISSAVDGIIMVLEGNAEELEKRYERNKDSLSEGIDPVFVIFSIIWGTLFFGGFAGAILAPIYGQKLGPGRYRWLGMNWQFGGSGGSSSGGWSSGSGGGGGWSSGGGGFSGGGGSSGGGGASGGW